MNKCSCCGTRFEDDDTTILNPGNPLCPFCYGYEVGKLMGAYLSSDAFEHKDGKRCL